MLRLAILSARGRLGTFAGALITLFASSVLVMAGGMTLEAALRNHPPVERYAAAAAVVTGQQIVGADHDVPLGERARVSSALALGWPPSPASAPRSPTCRRRPGSAAGPPSPTAGQRRADALRPERRTPARGPDEVVTGYPAALGSRLRLLLHGQPAPSPWSASLALATSSGGRRRSS